MLLALLAPSVECSIGDLDGDSTLDVLVAQDAKGLDPGWKKCQPPGIPGFAHALNPLFQFRNHWWFHRTSLLIGSPFLARSRKSNSNIPCKFALLDEPPEAGMGSGRSLGAVFQVAVDVKLIWRKRSLLFLQIIAELSPGLESVQHCHWLSHGNHLLGQAIQLLTPQGCTSSIHAFRRPKSSSFTEGLPQAIDTEPNLLRLVRTRSKAESTLRSQSSWAHRPTAGHSHLQLNFARTRGLRDSCLGLNGLDHVGKEVMGLFTFLPDTQPVTGDMVASIHDCLLEAAESKGKVIICHQAHLLPPLTCPHRLQPLLCSLSR